MEIGHIQVMPSGPLCGCGQRGCLESVSSRLVIASAAAAAAYRGDAPYLMEHAGTDIRQIRSGVLGDAVAAGDTVVESIVRDAAGWIGKGVATLVNLLVPDIVILGGGLVESMPDLFLEEVGRTADDTVMRGYRGSYTLCTAELGDDAAVMGAAAWAQAHVKGGDTK